VGEDRKKERMRVKLIVAIKVYNKRFANIIHVCLQGGTKMEKVRKVSKRERVESSIQS